VEIALLLLLDVGQQVSALGSSKLEGHIGEAEGAYTLKV
jgi:hypothetical protein